VATHKYLLLSFHVHTVYLDNYQSVFHQLMALVGIRLS